MIGPVYIYDAKGYKSTYHVEYDYDDNDDIKQPLSSHASDDVVMHCILPFLTSRSTVEKELQIRYARYAYDSVIRELQAFARFAACESCKESFRKLYASYTGEYDYVCRNCTHDTDDEWTATYDEFVDDNRDIEYYCLQRYDQLIYTFNNHWYQWTEDYDKDLADLGSDIANAEVAALLN